ncbi:MAG: S8 family serine peptidase [Planctomycetota bacterium]
MKSKQTKGKLNLLVLVLACAVTVSPAALGVDLEITPVDDFEPSGQPGGPFTPSSKDYQLTNVGPNSLWWGAYKAVDWLDLAPDWGPLGPSQSTIVTVSLTGEANSLLEGVHSDTMTFIDITNGGEQTRGVTLTISFGPGVLDITPIENFESSGEPGGPFTPSSKDYQLTNTGGDSLYWGAFKAVDWLSLEPDWGLLEPDQSTIVTVSLTEEANSLLEGVHSDTVTFFDITNGGEQTRGVTLTITPPAGIWVSPPSFDVNVIEGCTHTDSLTIGNNGLEELEFTIRTRVVSGSSAAEPGIDRLSSAQGVVSSIPKDHDFTVPGDAPYEPGELIVRFAAKANGSRLTVAEKNQILSSLGGGSIKRSFKIVPGLSVVELGEGITVEEALRTFNDADGILYAEPDYEVKALSTIPDDTRFDELWGMHNTGQTGGTMDADIDAPEAWDIATGNAEIVVAVIDTGVDYTHVDLADNMWINESEYNGTPGQDDDNNGYVDDIYGYDFRNNDGDPMDDHYHGTHCAGTIGGVGNNNEGVAGVCWDVSIMAVKFLSSGGSGTTEDAISSVEYTTLMGANLSSNSWGGGGYSQGLKDAIDAAGAAGMLFIASAGNDDENTDIHPHYPSSYDCESLISVMSTDHYDSKSGFSNYGLVSVDLGAPGSDILSCKLGGGYKYASGTSMAGPHVAGACALAWSMNPAMTNSEVKEILLRTVDPTLPGKCVSEGRLNVYDAILETRAPWIHIDPEEGTVGPGDTNEVSVTFSAVCLAPGTYRAEIVVMSNDADNPTKIVPVTMTVTPDDLQVTPLEGFDSTGTKGGPFEPQCTTYTLTNTGAGPVNWTTFEVEDWLDVDPCEGVLDPCESIDVNVCISPSANLLEPNLYSQVLTFQNADSNSIKPRLVTLTVKPPDMFAESFDESSTDLEVLMLTFMPDGTIAYYEACRERVREFPTDPNGGTYVSLWDDDFVEVVLSGGAQILFYGQWYDRFYIGSNGYITFGEGDTEYSASLENHFNMPRISAMFTDLDPPDDERISYKQLADRVVVTFESVPLYGDKTSTNSFQIEMFLRDGRIRVTWVELAQAAFVAGLSEGKGMPPVFFVESDLSEYPPCWPLCDLTRDYAVNFKDFALLAAHWRDADCNIPYWCGKSDFDRSGKTDMNDVGILTRSWLTKEDWWLQPIGHWEFEEGEGSVAYDSAGNNHGTLMGDACWAAGKIGSCALEFDGAGDGVYLEPSGGEDSPLNIHNADLTISAWVMIRGSGGTVVARSKPYYITYRLGTGATTAFINTYKQGPGHWVLSTDEILGEDTWYHIVGVFDRTEDTGRVYVDSIMQAEGSMTIDPLSNDAITKIGCRNDTSDVPFNGVIDDVRIYDRVLSDEEVRELFREGFGPKAYNPNPANGATGVDPHVVLNWLPGKGAISHDVYFGTDFNDVNDANTSSYVYMGNQEPTIWDPCGLNFETTYYWRIDEWSSGGTTKGDAWSFATCAQFDPNLNLIGWWQFEEGSGTMAYDSTGVNHGTLLGDASWVGGIIGDYALDFDGVGDGVYLQPSAGAGSPLNIYSTDLSISSWVRIRGTGGTIVARAKPLYITYRLGTTASAAFINTYKQGPGHWLLYTDDILEQDTWYHIVGVFDRTDDTGRVYVNGLQGAEGSMTIDPLSNDAMTKIGCRNDTGDKPFDGGIDDVRIYDKALSSAEVWQLYQEGLNQD